MKKGDLLTLLRNDKNVSLTTLFQMAKQAAAGMVYLEDRNIVHRDLALRKRLRFSSLTLRQLFSHVRRRQKFYRQSFRRKFFVVFY